MRYTPKKRPVHASSIGILGYLIFRQIHIFCWVKPIRFSAATGFQSETNVDCQRRMRCQDPRCRWRTKCELLLAKTNGVWRMQDKKWLVCDISWYIYVCISYNSLQEIQKSFNFPLNFSGILATSVDRPTDGDMGDPRRRDLTIGALLLRVLTHRFTIITMTFICSMIIIVIVKHLYIILYHYHYLSLSLFIIIIIYHYHYLSLSVFIIIIIYHYHYHNLSVSLIIIIIIYHYHYHNLSVSLIIIIIIYHYHYHNLSVSSIIIIII